MMQSIVGIVLVWMVMIPAIATADPPTTAEIKEIVNGLGQKVDALGKQLEQVGKEVIPKLTNIESNTKSLELQKKVEDLGKQLTNIETNTKATFSTTFWILVGSVLVTTVALIAAFSASTSNRLDRAAIDIERVLQTVAAARERPSIMDIAPIAGPAGSRITIRGSYFQRGVAVEIGGMIVPVMFESERRLTAQTPLNQAQGVIHDVRVINPDGQPAISLIPFTYAAPPAGGEV